MNFNALHYLVILAQERSFARAAKKLFVVQPTLRQAISGLEHELGTKLFVRGASPLTLTPAGSLYVKWAQETLRTHADTVQQVADLVEGTTSLTLSMSYSMAMVYANPLIKAFSAERPNCRLTIIERSSTNSQKDMETNGVADIMVGTLFDPSPAIQVEDVQEPLMLALPRSHPLCPPAGQMPELSALREMPFVKLYNNLSYDLWTNSLFADQDFQPEASFAASGYNSMLEMVACGAGFAILPQNFLLWRSHPDVAVFPIPDPNHYRSIQVAWRKDRYFNQDMACMLEQIHRIIGGSAD